MKLFGCCFLIVIFAFTTKEVLSQTREPAFEMNDRLGQGVNMGNAFEAPSETAWGNPWKPEYFKIMADLGFKHVRLPVRWEPADRSLATPPYTINATFMNRIQEVVDEALKNKLHIIVNMHHHEALFDDPDGQKERFLSMWSQIGEHFKDYSDSLLFEVLNEPHGNLTPDKWNVFFEDALTEIRKSNPTRAVLLGVAEYGGLGGLVHLDVPNDEHIILSIHYYNPFNFTHQGAEWVDNSDPWLGTKWNDTEIDRETVESEFSFAQQFAESNSIPIHIGEFGAYSKADMASREKWTTFLARWFEEQGFSWAYWEFSAGFGLYDPDTEQLIEPISNALLVNEMPDPVPVYTTSIYSSDFSSNTDGWTLNTQQGAAGSASVSNGNLNVSLTNGGSEAWHAQLVKNGITFEQNEMYRVSFSIQATTNRSATFYAGKASDPWNAYSGYNGISLTDLESSFVFSFTMSEPTDNAARLVFDLGKSAVGVSLSNIKVEKVSFVVTALAEAIERKVRFYPNPVENMLHVDHLDDYSYVELIDQQGRVNGAYHPNLNETSLDMSRLASGLYIVRLVGDGMEDRIKVMKR